VAILVFSSVSLLGYGIGALRSLVDFSSERVRRIRRPSDMPYERIEVACYSGYKANERPIAFTLQGVRREVQDILDRWYEGGSDSRRPATSYFKLRTREGQMFIIRYQSLFDAWSIQT
jgi:hypothetical protein